MIQNPGKITVSAIKITGLTKNPTAGCSQIPKDLLCLMNAGTDRAVLSRTVMIFLSGNIKKRSKGYKYKKNTYNRCYTFFLSYIRFIELNYFNCTNF